MSNESTEGCEAGVGDLPERLLHGLLRHVRVVKVLPPPRLKSSSVMRFFNIFLFHESNPSGPLIIRLQ